MMIYYGSCTYEWIPGLYELGAPACVPVHRPAVFGFHVQSGPD